MSDDDALREATERVGTVLGGKYHIDSVLGTGGMAVVYAATHRNRKRFAVKVLHPELCARRDIRARFLREGYVANSVNHPGVVAVLDDDVDADGSAFLVMELLDGATVDALGSRLDGRLPVREALAVTHQLLDVLTVAHNSNVIHRDIKPANLFVSKDGQVKVLDFGIARLRDVAAGVQSTRAGALIGTPSFMAPEQALAQGDEIDPRTDVWAAGASLFNMLSGRFVHEGDNARQLMIRAATVPARSLADVAPDAPAAVVELVAKALAFEKSARWESAAAMREAVAQIHEELFGAIAPEHLKACVEQAQREFERAHTMPSPPDAPPLHGSEKVTKRAADPVGTAAESPDARRHGAASHVASTTSRPVSNRKTEGKPGRRRAAVVGLVFTTLGLSAGIFAMKTARHSSEDRPMPASEGQPPLPQSTVRPTPSPIAPVAEVPPTSPSTEASGAPGTINNPAAAGVVPPPRSTPPPASTAGPRIALGGGMPTSTPAKANTLRSAPSASAEPSKRDPLHIELQ
jgi:serine/threonine-protein kinase